LGIKPNLTQQLPTKDYLELFPLAVGYVKLFSLAVVGVIGFLTVIVIFSRMSRGVSDDDPMLDMMANPNIRVGE